MKKTGAVKLFVVATSMQICIFGSALGAEEPDPSKTPGAFRSDLSLEQACATKWGRDRRAVSASMKLAVLRAYGLKGPHDKSQGCLGKRGYEVDHKYPRCGTGADDVRNLWAQCYSGRWNAVQKDRLEVLACKMLCKGEITLEGLQAWFDDWQKAYTENFGAK